MAKAVKKAASSNEDKPKRVILTGAEKLAKMEADIAAERERQAQAAAKKLVAAKEELTKATEAQAKATARVEKAQANVDELEQLAGTAEPSNTETSEG